MQNTADHTVLIVDDDQIVGKALGHLVKHLGAQSVYVPSGRQVLEKISAADPPFFPCHLQLCNTETVENMSAVVKASKAIKELEKMANKVAADMNIPQYKGTFL